MDQIEKNDPLLETTTIYSIAHVAKQIESKLMNRLDCSECMMVFEKDLKVQNITYQMQSRPCRSTFKICQHVDKFMKLHDIRQGTDKKEHDFRVSYCLKVRSDCAINCSNSTAAIELHSLIGRATRCCNGIIAAMEIAAMISLHSVNGLMQCNFPCASIFFIACRSSAIFSLHR